MSSTEERLRDFAHLHVLSDFSYGVGVSSPREFAERAGEHGYAYLALTDRDGLHGIPRFLEAAGECGLKGIVGAEITMDSGGRLVLLCEGPEGYRSLSNLITAYRSDEETRKSPVCSLEALKEHTRGLICLTGAVPNGALPRQILDGHVGEATELVRALVESFGEGRVFVELTDDRTYGSRRRIARIADFAREMKLPVVATNEVTYLSAREHRLHEVVSASAALTRIPGPDYRPTDQLYLKSPSAMTRLFADYLEALTNSLRIAERCGGSVVLDQGVQMPAYRGGDGGEVSRRRLLALVLEGARRKYGREDRELVLSRLKREVECIYALGFTDYFLIAREAADIARERGIPVTGRGSAANSLVSYCLGLTHPEPLSNRLLFERFLHEGRSDPPDIDLDFCSVRRDEIRDEMLGRYAGRGVAVAGTVSTFSLRGAVRCVARALGHPASERDELSRHVPTRIKDRDRILNPMSGWDEALAEPAMKGHPLQDTERYALLLELAWKLAGRNSGAGTHLGGLVIGTRRDRLSDLVPLEASGQSGLLRCQFDKGALEYAGLPKLDLLGLRMHTALERAGELASLRTGRRVEALSPPENDRETYRLIQSGHNTGMFQLESPGQMNLSRRLRPRRISDLIAQISLFRPGPVRGDLVTPYVLRRNGIEPYSVPAPELDGVLRPTYGVLIFQEQVLEVARDVAGFTLAEGDGLRRAMTGSRGPGALEKFKEEFVSRAVENGVSEESAREVFGWMEGFSVYGFSAAHAASFAEIAYASAYMRTHYPAEFFCGLLDAQPVGFFSPRVLLNEARRVGIEILPPDIALSGRQCSVEEEGRALRVGFEYCRGLSRRAIDSVIVERRRKPFASPEDLYGRTEVNREALENLVRGGYLDGIESGNGTRHPDRAGLIERVESLPKKRPSAWRSRQPEIPLKHPAHWWSKRERWRTTHLPLSERSLEVMEWRALSLNVRRHPLSRYRSSLSELEITPARDVPSMPHGSVLRVAGVFETLQMPPTKSGKPVYFLLTEDESGLLQSTIFKGVYRRYGWLLHHRFSFLVEGRVEQDPKRGFSFVVSRIEDLGEYLSSELLVEGESRPAPGSLLRSRRRGRRRAG